MTILYRIGSLNATRTYPVQCRHDLKVSSFVRSENQSHKKALFVMTMWKLYASVQPGISHGRESFLE